MALQYEYLDTYIVSNVDITELEAAETKALEDLGKQGITDTFYLRELCICLVYIDLGTRQLESESMGDKVKGYEAIYQRYSQMDIRGNEDAGIISGEIGRA